MHVAGVSLDLNLFLKFIITAFVLVLGLLHLLKNTASKYFEVDGASFDNTDRSSMPGVIVTDSTCAVCGANSVKICSRCKAVRYCSETCQRKHWRSSHQKECNSTKTSDGRKNFKGIALVPTNKSTTKRFKHPKKILFPYDEFIELFHWDKPGFPPCGLLNCGNSCFANVVLQCLSSTRPLVAYLLEKGHRRECIREEWCFLCEFESHIERVSRSSHAFSPTNIISRLPNIGGNLGYGRQEDAHELMRFAIDTMQSVCLGEFGGEKAVQPSSQETTIIQHIFGGQLQSQVICTKCNNISNQYENMMDLTVEIHGDDSSLEECLDQFTVKEWLHGDNMYKCDGCNDYVKAWKRLTVKRAPNVLTIALKRFQSGRFGKINKRVTFPESLDLSPYMSEAGDGTDIYSLYGVVVHVDMLNASYFGHYVCYTKDFNGKWYKIDDCEVTPVHLDEVLSQGAYMLLYSRVRARPSCMSILEPPRKEVKASAEVESLPSEPDKCSPIESAVPTCHPGSEPSDITPPQQLSNYVEDSSAEPKHSDEGTDVAHLRSPLSVEEVHIIENGKIDIQSSSFVTREISSCEKASAGALDLDMARGDLIGVDLANGDVCQEVSQEASACCGKDLSSADDMDIDNWEPSTFVEDDIEIHRSNGATDASHEKATPVEHPKLPNGLPNGNGFHRLQAQQVNDDG